MATLAQCQARYDAQEHPDYYGCEEDNWDTESIAMRITFHIAQKDHLSKQGNVVVKKGQPYTYYYDHCYDVHLQTGERQNYRVDIHKAVISDIDRAIRCAIGGDRKEKLKRIKTRLEKVK